MPHPFGFTPIPRKTACRSPARPTAGASTQRSQISFRLRSGSSILRRSDRLPAARRLGVLRDSGPGDRAAADNRASVASGGGVALPTLCKRDGRAAVSNIRPQRSGIRSRHPGGAGRVGGRDRRVWWAWARRSPSNSCVSVYETYGWSTVTRCPPATSPASTVPRRPTSAAPSQRYCATISRGSLRISTAKRRPAALHRKGWPVPSSTAT